RRSPGLLDARAQVAADVGTDVGVQLACAESRQVEARLLGDLGESREVLAAGPPRLRAPGPGQFELLLARRDHARAGGERHRAEPVEGALVGAPGGVGQ